ncbi:PREDICTED: uncharacterized protein LOC109186243 [Ipomoea nil]|uniref:uncharacterized protein LOC109186243 n=1 Tax=Ipomoea nil TaxID=35883 RepID=UPI000901CDF6|nr:PREDICTED: uncharacterized protein LOC109186243 [Ipomoea nil]
MASSKLRQSCSFPILLVSFLNFILSAASIAPMILLKMPPTSLGYAFLMVSSISLFSALIGFYSQFCFTTHVTLLLGSSLAQFLAFLTLFTRENPSLAMLKSPRDPREAKVLVRLECGLMMVMFVMQLGVLVVSCVVQWCWVRRREDQSAEAAKEAWAQKKREWMVKVHENEGTVPVTTKIGEVKGLELDEKMKSKCGQCV